MGDKTPVDYGLISLNLDVIDFIVKYPELGRYETLLGSCTSSQEFFPTLRGRSDYVLGREYHRNSGGGS
jgi:hypothetical protein